MLHNSHDFETLSAYINITNEVKAPSTTRNLIVILEPVPRFELEGLEVPLEPAAVRDLEPKVADASPPLERVVELKPCAITAFGIAEEISSISSSVVNLIGARATL